SANEELADFPYLLNENPYDEGWIVDVAPSDQDFETGFFDLNDPAQREEYEKFLQSEKLRIESMS
ncbi:MAG: hypothetical protein FWG38_04760, partial [Defluviitaleaceae bacterium]|nr:hypothetical protein [Defluviitaleaceae bacterium]